jgi:ABC-type phosphate/phosphonate transport system substrate-binding protein
MRSCSGHLLLGAFLGPDAMQRKVSEELYTGSHVASMEAVATGKADLAAIDCVTWSLVKEQRASLANRLRVIGMAPVKLPGLAYVVTSRASASQIEAIRGGLRRCLTGNSITLLQLFLTWHGF